MRQYFKDIDDSIYDKVAELNLVGIPTDVRITEQQVSRTIDWMKLGTTKKINLSYDAVVLNAPVGKPRMPQNSTECGR